MPIRAPVEGAEPAVPAADAITTDAVLCRRTMECTGGSIPDRRVGSADGDLLVDLVDRCARDADPDGETGVPTKR
jgi:hypothetical protein